MKTIKSLLLLTFIIAAFSSCISARSVQKQLNNLYADLDYELVSPVYEGEREKTVYLNRIHSSKMESYTKVQNSNVLVLPFILFNYFHKKINIVLGEHSLTQDYHEFLTDALLAECNRSTSFFLKTNDAVSAPDACTLDIAISHNKTQSGIKETDIFVILPTGSATFDFFDTNYRVLPTSCDLEIAVSLKKGTHILLEKKYHSQQYFKYSSYGSLFDVNEQCVFKMTQCLALATEHIVTEISRDLNLILSAQ